MLKFVKDNGYNIKIIKGFNWDKSYNVFKHYVDKLFVLKALSSDPILKNIAKLLLNNLFARFGMSPYQDITKVVTRETADYMLLTINKVNQKELTDNHTMITYKLRPYYDTCKRFGLNLSDALNSDEFAKADPKSVIKSISVTTAAVTTYSRVHINTLKLRIINELEG